jgi:hypothetical protein
MGQGGFGGFAAVGLLLTAALGGASCGTSNDQGISFRALGFFVDPEQGSVVTPVDGDDDTPGGVVIIDTESAAPDPGAVTPLAFECTALIRTALGVENTLIQGIRVERIELGYRIPGASINLPSVGFPVGHRLGPSSGQEAFNDPRGFYYVVVISPPQLEFLNQNRNRLPELPFTMTVLATAVGVADSGDVFRTQETPYQITFLDDIDCFPQPGEQPIPGGDPGSNPQPTVAPFQTPAPQPQPTVFP